MLNTIRDTTKHVYWNSHDHCYVALMSETPSCRAEGATPAEAIGNVERAYARYDSSVFDTEPARRTVPVYATLP